MYKSANNSLCPFFLQFRQFIHHCRTLFIFNSPFFFECFHPVRTAWQFPYVSQCLDHGPVIFSVGSSGSHTFYFFFIFFINRFWVFLHLYIILLFLNLSSFFIYIPLIHIDLLSLLIYAF